MAAVVGRRLERSVRPHSAALTRCWKLGTRSRARAQSSGGLPPLRRTPERSVSRSESRAEPLRRPPHSLGLALPELLNDFDDSDDVVIQFF